MAPAPTTTIPLCRSPFLQDVTIALGQRSLKSLRMAHRSLTFEVSNENVDDRHVERLSIEARDAFGHLKKIVIWEDYSGWIYHAEAKRGRPAHVFLNIYADFSNTSAEAIANLIRATLDNPGAAEADWRSRPLDRKGPSK